MAQTSNSNLSDLNHKVDSVAILSANKITKTRINKETHFSVDSLKVSHYLEDKTKIKAVSASHHLHHLVVKVKNRAISGNQSLKVLHLLGSNLNSKVKVLVSEEVQVHSVNLIHKILLSKAPSLNHSKTNVTQHSLKLILSVKAKIRVFPLHKPLKTLKTLSHNLRTKVATFSIIRDQILLHCLRVSVVLLALKLRDHKEAFLNRIELDHKNLECLSNLRFKAISKLLFKLMLTK